MSGRVAVLGVDPGTIVTGFGALSCQDGAIEVLGWGHVKTSPRSAICDRLARIHEETVRQIAQHRPDIVAVENVFQAKNVRSALLLGHARGVAILAAAQAGLPVCEYAPREVKRSVVGVGSASKTQVASMVHRLLGIDVEGLREDETDALAVALCHIHKSRGERQDDR